MQDYVAFTEAAAEALVRLKVRAVGIDYLSVDLPQAHALPVHHLLLGNDILLIEGLHLTEVSAGRVEIIIAPMKISEIDGAPPRVLLRIE